MKGDELSGRQHLRSKLFVALEIWSEENILIEFDMPLQSCDELLKKHSSIFDEPLSLFSFPLSFDVELRSKEDIKTQKRLSSLLLISTSSFSENEQPSYMFWMLSEPKD